jgi:type VI secretion system Hcp family effector
MAKFLLTMTLAKQGKIKGSSTRTEGNLKYSDGMECQGFSYSPMTQIDPNSGISSGKRKHSPIVIRREVDAASPKLLQALVTNEVFTTATLSFSRLNPNGKPVAAHKIELINGTISNIKQAADSRGKWSQDVTLTFEELVVDGMPNGVIPWTFSPKA